MDASTLVMRNDFNVYSMCIYIYNIVYIPIAIGRIRLQITYQDWGVSVMIFPSVGSTKTLQKLVDLNLLAGFTVLVARWAMPQAQPAHAWLWRGGEADEVT